MRELLVSKKDVLFLKQQAYSLGIFSCRAPSESAGKPWWPWQWGILWDFHSIYHSNRAVNVEVGCLSYIPEGHIHIPIWGSNPIQLFRVSTAALQLWEKETNVPYLEEASWWLPLLQHILLCHSYISSGKLDRIWPWLSKVVQVRYLGSKGMSLLPESQKHSRIYHHDLLLTVMYVALWTTQESTYLLATFQHPYYLLHFHYNLVVGKLILLLYVFSIFSGKKKLQRGHVNAPVYTPLECNLFSVDLNSLTTRCL